MSRSEYTYDWNAGTWEGTNEGYDNEGYDNAGYGTNDNYESTM